MSKRIILIFILFFSILNISTSQAVVNGIVGCYLLEGNGDDSSGNGNHAAIIYPIFTVPDRFDEDDKAISFNGPTELIIPADFNFFQKDSAFTISFWYFGATVIQDDYEVIFHKDQDGLPVSPNSVSAGIYENSKLVFSQCVQQTDTIFIYKWNHAVLTYNNGTRNLYINKNLEDSSQNDFFEENLTIPQFGKNYGGSLDDIILYNRELSPQEVNLLYYQYQCDQITNTKEAINKSLTIFPNPSDNYIFIKDVQWDNIYITNLNGTLIQKIENVFSTNDLKIEIDSFSNGVYFLLIEKDGKFNFEKFIKI